MVEQLSAQNKDPALVFPSTPTKDTQINDLVKSLEEESLEQKFKQTIVTLEQKINRGEFQELLALNRPPRVVITILEVFQILLEWEKTK